MYKTNKQPMSQQLKFAQCETNFDGGADWVRFEQYLALLLATALNGLDVEIIQQCEIPVEFEYICRTKSRPDFIVKHDRGCIIIDAKHNPKSTIQLPELVKSVDDAMRHKCHGVIIYARRNKFSRDAIKFSQARQTQHEGVRLLTEEDTDVHAELRKAVKEILFITEDGTSDLRTTKTPELVTAVKFPPRMKETMQALKQKALLEWKKRFNNSSTKPMISTTITTQPKNTTKGKTVCRKPKNLVCWKNKKGPSKNTHTELLAKLRRLMNEFDELFVTYTEDDRTLASKLGKRPKSKHINYAVFQAIVKKDLTPDRRYKTKNAGVLGPGDYIKELTLAVFQAILEATATQFTEL